ncbi:MAG: DUF308 domain-containing protein [Sphingopyxis terrae]|nr:DUF308 domain-containing protein [Sphingopyxis terrae]
MAPLHERLFDPDTGTARIASLWWAMALRGAGAVVLGSLALLWPDITLIVLVFLFAAYCVVDAVFSIILAVRGARRHDRWWWPALHALVALAAAAAAVLYPGITLIVFVAMLIAWALFTGVFSVAAAFRLDRAHGRWWYVASGVVSLILAALLIALPGMGLLTLTWMIAFQALLAGSLLLGLAFRLRMRSTASAAGEESGLKVRPDDRRETA